MEHSLPCAEDFGMNSGATAALLCCKVFGRDEVEVTEQHDKQQAQLVFTQLHIDNILWGWKEIMRPATWGMLSAPSPGRI
eukprot:COSAG05_NODE_9711_length_607_cov_0.702756_1_plen_79_part_10